jgi:simple sugar transport system permease protein
MPTVFALFSGFFVGALFLILTGYDPIRSYAAMLEGVFSRPKYLIQVISKSAPLALTGLSVAFAFKCGLFNIGSEGQYTIGVIVATLLGTKLSLPFGVHFIVIMLAGMIFAGIWGAIVGFLKVKFGINEVVTAIMLNWIALHLHRYVFSFPWLLVKNIDASQEIKETARSAILHGFIATPKGQTLAAKNAFLADILKTDLNFGIFLAIGAAFAIHHLLNSTTKGFELRAMGINQEASRFAGMNIKRNVILSMFISGAISGLAGVIQLTGFGPFRMTNLAAFEGYGLEGIYIALVANCSPIGCIASGLFFSAIKCGSALMQIEVGTPREIIKIITGLIIFFIAIPFAYKLIASKIQKTKKDTINHDE